METKNLTFDKVDITGGFWYEKQKLIRDVTIHAVYDRFCETGRIGAFRMDWKEGQPNKPHFFWDSDVAKWMESAAYLCQKKREPELEKAVDQLVEQIDRGRMADGYFNLTYQTQFPEKRFTERNNHELYCAGHFIEAAIAYDRATGKHRFLELMLDYAALIRKVFQEEKSAAFSAPGHEEIELALIRLAEYTKDRQWLELASFFVEQRGRREKTLENDQVTGRRPFQDHLPVRQQHTAEGHAVRLAYLFCAVADLARLTDDSQLRQNALDVYDSITKRRMYVTGSVGSTNIGEKFEDDYKLPLDTAYAETCAALGTALFCRRMEELDDDARYADTAERILYNGFLSGLSLDGKKFFYENAQEIDLKQREFSNQWGEPEHFPITQRVACFSCSCCPPNITRLIPSVGDFLYNYRDDVIYVNQYMPSEADFGDTRLIQKTGYPYDGAVEVQLLGKARTLALRIPGWCGSWKLLKNGRETTAEVRRGFAFVEAGEKDVITLVMDMQVRYIRANPHVRACRGLTAVGYGPFVLCMEGLDNGGDLSGVRLKKGGERVQIRDGVLEVFLPAVRETTQELYTDRFTREEFTARLIPYYTFANRGETDMKIWLPAES